MFNLIFEIDETRSVQDHALVAVYVASEYNSGSEEIFSFWVSRTEAESLTDILAEYFD